MSNISLMELYILAGKIEKKGLEFYQKLYRKVKTEDGKNFLRYLMKEEEDHLGRFKQLIEEYSGTEPVSQITDIMDYDTLIGKYLDTFFPDNIFSSDSMKNIRWDDTESLFWFAMQMEKDSIRFYEKLKEFDKEQKNHNILDEIIAQEHMHVQRLNEIARKQI